MHRLKLNKRLFPKRSLSFLSSLTHQTPSLVFAKKKDSYRITGTIKVKAAYFKCFRPRKPKPYLQWHTLSARAHYCIGLTLYFRCLYRDEDMYGFHLYDDPTPTAKSKDKKFPANVHRSFRVYAIGEVP